MILLGLNLPLVELTLLVQLGTAIWLFTLLRKKHH